MRLFVCLVVLISFNSAYAMDSQQRVMAIAGGAGIVAGGFAAANTLASYAQEGYKREYYQSGKPDLLKIATMAGLVRSSTSIAGVSLLNYAIYDKTISANPQTYSSLASLILCGTCIELAAAHYWLSDEHSKSNIKKFLIAGGSLALLGAVGILRNK